MGRKKAISKSPSGKLDATDWQKIGKGAAIAALGGLLAWCTASLIPGTENDGTDTGIILAGALSILVNTARKWIQDNSE